VTATMEKVNIIPEDDYAWWRNALTGVFGPVNVDEPKTGFYRGRHRNRDTNEVTFSAIAYWYKDGVLKCTRDGRMLDDTKARELWNYVSRHPITDELYFAVTRDGKPWPDVSDVVMGHNAAPVDDSAEAIAERLDDLAREAERLIKAGAATDEDVANQASDLANTFSELQAKAVGLHKIEKQPHLDAGRAVDTKWFGLRDKADDLKKRLKAVVVTPWLVKKQDEARRVQQAAIAIGTPPEAVPEVRTTAGATKRSTGLRTYRVAVIEDKAKLLDHLKDHPEVTALLQKIADGAANKQIPLPGCSIKEEKRAA
jgi:hypothetical protein